jgi:hypothetical protein
MFFLKKFNIYFCEQTNINNTKAQKIVEQQQGISTGPLLV